MWQNQYVNALHNVEFCMQRHKLKYSHLILHPIEC